jgi:hypothetical protein
MTVPPGPPQQPGWQPPGGQTPPGRQPQSPPPGFQPQGYPPPGYPRQPGHPQQPGHPPQPGYPQGGFQVPAPPPPPTTKRIPEDMPFVVRPSVRKRLLLFGGIAAVVSLPFGCVIGLTGVQESKSIAIGLAVGLCLFVLIFGIFSLQVWLITSGGPVLALNQQGLWIKTRPTRGQAIWLPWEGVERITRRRWSLEKMLVVKARDPRAGSNLGAYTALDSGMLKLFFGSGFTATLNFADKPEQEIVNAVAHFAAGRAPII